MKKLALISINQDGLQSSLKLNDLIKDIYDIEIYTRSEIHTGIAQIFHSLDVIIEHLWKTHDLIFFAATGIVVRKIAPFLISKDRDPAVIVMSFDLTMIVPLLSGHLGGANEISQKIASIVPDGKAFITTASDQKNLYAFDLFARKHSLKIENLSSLKIISSSLIDEKEIHIYSYPSIFQLLKEDFHNSMKCFVFHDPFEEMHHPSVLIAPVMNGSYDLKIRIPSYSIGIGLNSGTPLEEIENCFLDFLNHHHLNIEECTGIASFDAKQNETGLLNFAKKYNWNPLFFSADDINRLQDNFSESRAEDYFGIKGVAEPCSVLHSRYKTLFIKKIKYENITLAAAF